MKHLLQRQLKRAASGDSLRPAMEGVYYDKDAGELVTTDGHKMLRYKPETIGLDADSVSGIIPLEAFPKKQQKHYRTRLDERDGIVTVTTEHEGRPVSMPCIDEQYPQWQNVVPDAASARYRIAVDLDVVAEFARALPNDKDSPVANHAILTFNESSRAVVVEPLNPETAGWTGGLIMPVRVDFDRSDYAPGDFGVVGEVEVADTRVLAVERDEYARQLRQAKQELEHAYDELRALRGRVVDLERELALGSPSGDGQAGQPPAIDEPADAEPQPLTLERYSERGLALRGDCRHLAGKLKRYGRFNPHLTGGEGWVFSVRRRQWLLDLLEAEGQAVEVLPDPAFA